MSVFQKESNLEEMSDCSIIIDDLTGSGGLRSPKMRNSDIEEKLVSDVASNVDFKIPEFTDKQADQLLTKVWECGICSKIFGRKYTLMRHLPTHTDERKFHCNICGKNFRQMATLSEHWAVHSADRPYICEICHKAFKRMSGLVSHRKIHTGFKPYRCHMCKKAFYEKGNLRSHIFSHKNVRLYKCHLCTKGFKQMSDLVCHIIKTHQRADKPRCQIRGGNDFQKRMCLRKHEQYQHGVQNPEPTASQTNNVKYPNGVLVEPINTPTMRYALTNKETPFAFFKPLNSNPMLMRVLADGEKQMLVTATVEDLKKYGKIVTPQVDENKKVQMNDPLAEADKPLEEANEATIKSLGSTVQLKIPLVATVMQRYRKDDNKCMVIENREPSTSGIGNQNYVSTTTSTENLDGVNPTIDYGDYTTFDEKMKIEI